MLHLDLDCRAADGVPESYVRLILDVLAALRFGCGWFIASTDELGEHVAQTVGEPTGSSSTGPGHSSRGRTRTRAATGSSACEIGKVEIAKGKFRTRTA